MEGGRGCESTIVIFSEEIGRLKDGSSAIGNFRHWAQVSSTVSDGIAAAQILQIRWDAMTQAVVGVYYSLFSRLRRAKNQPWGD